jgi:LysR family transcriptional regulator, hca operon transcriptional activator
MIAKSLFSSMRNPSDVSRRDMRNHCSGHSLEPEYEAENLSMAMSLVASTGGMTLLPL